MAIIFVCNESIARVKQCPRSQQENEIKRGSGKEIFGLRGF